MPVTHAGAALGALATLASLATAGCGGDGGGGSTDCGGCGPCSGVVARVIDGDTIELKDGSKVRYLLVDAPETTSGHDDCGGTEAVTFNTQMVGDQTISLRYDAAGCRDMYGRLLAYVSVQGREVNSLLIERGYACVLFVPPAGATREVEFKTVQAEAKAAHKGIWGTCNPVTCLQ